MQDRKINYLYKEWQVLWPISDKKEDDSDVCIFFQS